MNNGKKRNRIIFNSLPPSDLTTPSAAFSIMKSFMEKNSYKVFIKYWGFELGKTISELFYDIDRIPDPELAKLIPFICNLAIDMDDDLSRSKIRVFIQANNPYGINYKEEQIEEKIENTVKKFRDIFDIELSRIIKDDVLILGFSAIFDQWIPAMIMAKLVKEKYPKVKTVIGGFGNKREALAVMKISEYFDFAIWGEGEYSLLDLCNQLNTTNVFSEISRIIYRDKKEILITGFSNSKHLDIEEEIYPNFDDFKEQCNNLEDNQFNILIEGSRGCNWNKCKFCFLNDGYKYRIKTNDRIYRELVYFANKYPEVNIQFTDNDNVGANIENFENLLDKLILYNRKNQNPIKISSMEIIPVGITSDLIKKIAKAGVMEVQIGYEAISDNILRKYNKKSTFAENILFVKFAKKYGISVSGLNIIQDNPDETDMDIIESIDNLHYLRFILSKSNYYHNHIKLTVKSNSRYYKEHVLNKEENWGLNKIVNLMPEAIWNDIAIFDLMQFARINRNPLWERLISIDKHYKNADYNYRIIKNELYFYEEYFNGHLIYQIEFNQSEYWDILKNANNKVCSIEDLKNELNKKYNFSEREIMKKINDLSSSHILYSNSDYSKIVTIIDTDLEF